MELETVTEILMKRDGLSFAQAEYEVACARRELNERLAQGELPFDICEECFGLEPDYIFDLI